MAVEEEKKETKDIKPSKPLLFPDPTSSDHVVALTKLNDQVLSLQRQLSEKDKQLIAKDRQICELKADMAKQDRDARSKFQDTVKRHAEQMNEMQVCIELSSSRDSKLYFYRPLSRTYISSPSTKGIIIVMTT